MYFFSKSITTEKRFPSGFVNYFLHFFTHRSWLGRWMNYLSRVQLCWNRVRNSFNWIIRNPVPLNTTHAQCEAGGHDLTKILYHSLSVILSLNQPPPPQFPPWAACSDLWILDILKTEEILLFVLLLVQ